MRAQQSSIVGVSKIPLRARDGSVRAYALVDTSDLVRLSAGRWSLHSTGRPVRSIRGSFVYLARIVAEVEDGYYVKHKNGDPLDCRKANLLVRRRHINSSRGAQLLRNFGIDEHEYGELLEGQNFQCAICSCNVDDQRAAGKAFAVDHCHIEGHVRRLLCFSCNVAIGKLNDDVELLLKAIEYLEN